MLRACTLARSGPKRKSPKLVMPPPMTMRCGSKAWTMLGHTRRQIIQRLVPEGVGGGVPSFKGPQDGVGRDLGEVGFQRVEQRIGTSPCHVPCPPPDAAAGSVLLQAALPAAVAALTVNVHLKVAQFARVAVLSRVQLTADDHAAADAGRDGQVDQVLMAPSRSEAEFGQRGGIGVVVQRNGQRPACLGQARFQTALEREINPARQVRRIFDDAGVAVKRTAAADADAGDFTCAAPKQREAQLQQLPGHAFGAEIELGRRSQGIQQLALGADDARRQFGAAHVQRQDVRGRSLCRRGHTVSGVAESRTRRGLAERTSEEDQGTRDQGIASADRHERDKP